MEESVQPKEKTMALKATIKSMRKLLADMHSELDGAEKGNKAASKRARKNTLRFAKVAKMFRKESVAAGKKGKKRR
jgi:hypothetical protein